MPKVENRPFAPPEDDGDFLNPPEVPAAPPLGDEKKSDEREFDTK